MSWSRPELIALGIVVVVVALGLGRGEAMSNSNSDVTTAEQQMEHELSILRAHRQLLQAEIARLYMDTFSAETPMMLQQLQQRQRDIQLQIEALESKMNAAQNTKDSEMQLAHRLINNFGYLQRKLDDLNQQVDATNQGSNIRQLTKSQRDANNNSTPRTPMAATVSSYFWRPFVTTPAYTSDSIVPPAQASPSLIRRVLAMLRPNAAAAAATTADRWPTPAPAKSQTQQQFSAEELLPQLQLQRLYLDDAIKRLEQLANNNLRRSDNTL